MTTQGDLISGGPGGEPKRLAPGTSGQFLKTQGAGADPVWGDVPAGTVFEMTFTAGEKIHQGRAVYIGTDGKIYETDASSTSKIQFIGFAKEDIASGNSGVVQVMGVIALFSGLTIQSIYYLSNKSTESNPKQESSSNSIDENGPNVHHWQSFKAVGDRCERVELYVGNRATAGTQILYLQIREGEGLGGNPFGPQLSLVIPPSSTAWRVFTFSPPIYFTPGSVYTLDFWEAIGAMTYYYDASNPYADGRADLNASYDFVFRIGKNDLGLIGTSPGTNSVQVGRAISSTQLRVNV
jgi:hypothetical protein